MKDNNINNMEQSVKHHSLSNKAISGMKWVMGLRLSRRMISMIKNVILARLLLPSDFGLLGVALLGVAVFSTFSQTGFRSALVQKEDNIEDYFNSAWTLQVLRGFLIVFLAFIFAPFIADIFKEPRAVNVIRVFACIEIFRGFTNIRVIFFQRNFEFHKQFLYEISGVLADIFIAIPLAYFLRSVWALVFGVMANEFVLCVMSFIIYKQIPRFDFHKEKLLDLFSFGKWITFSYIINFLKNSLDSIFVSRILGAASLGIYQMSRNLANLMTMEISYTVSSVVFPAYARMQGDIARLKDAYFRVLKTIAIVASLIAGGFIVLGTDMVHVVFGPKWLPMILPLKLLSVGACLTTVGSSVRPLFMGIGKPKLSSVIDFIYVVVLFSTVIYLTPIYKLEGTSFAFFISSALYFILMTGWTCKVLNIALYDLFRILMYPFSIAFVVCVLGIILSASINSMGHILRFMILTGYYTVSFLISIIIAEKYFSYNIWPIMERFIPNGKIKAGLANFMGEKDS